MTLKESKKAPRCRAKREAEDSGKEAGTSPLARSWEFWKHIASGQTLKNCVLHRKREHTPNENKMSYRRRLAC